MMRVLLVRLLVKTLIVYKVFKYSSWRFVERFYNATKVGVQEETTTNA